MTYDALIPAGCRTPGFWYRLRHIRFWVWPWVPAAVEVSAMQVTAHIDGQWLDVFASDHPAVRAFRERFYAANPKLMEQKAKAGGLAWWLPSYSHNYRRTIHPNSCRLTFSLLGVKYGYAYLRGTLRAAPTTVPYTGKRPAFWPCRLFSYRLGPWLGGTQTAPFPVRIRCTVRTLSRKEARLKGV